MFRSSFREGYWSRRFQMNYSRAWVLRVRILHRAFALMRITRRWRFPVLVGEWYVQVEFDNTLTEQGYALNAGLYAFAAHTYGSPYWKANFLATPLLTVWV
ncbi:uncharacterized protein APUU_70384S [Aspergillus puulaauensis]|uniref:Uncharacterized protein n=1 Tax=Aspergillus puulaauensis TaxID=1220207 RepID=A0A7R7XY72_9EURO|nr:uncharacterized protein APUU_70384S [Aspergillus puulaauensis]BCS28814.1 hypothetical protein APUU_70384S [Aspergillus puulaauensis]